MCMIWATRADCSGFKTCPHMIWHRSVQEVQSVSCPFIWVGRCGHWMSRMQWRWRCVTSKVRLEQKGMQPLLLSLGILSLGAFLPKCGHPAGTMWRDHIKKRCSKSPSRSRPQLSESSQPRCLTYDWRNLWGDPGLSYSDCKGMRDPQAKAAWLRPAYPQIQEQNKGLLLF